MDTRLLENRGDAVLTLAFAVAFLMNANAAVADISADTDTILNWAEQRFPDILPSHQATQTLSPWLYRAYASTDFYTGINTQDNKVYYITGNALRKGESPVLFDTVANALKLVTPSAPPSGKVCDVSKISTGHTLTQAGNVLKVSTKTCIPEPDNLDYCPQQAMENGISIKTTKDVTVTTNGESEVINVVSCTKNASSDSSTPIIEMDVCYTDDSTPPVSSKAQGKIVYEQVEDCLKTNASTVEDIFNDEFWVNTGEGFVKLKKLGLK